MKVFIAEYTFRNKKSNDLKKIKIALEDAKTEEAEKNNWKEYTRVCDKLENMGWVLFPSENEKEWN